MYILPLPLEPLFFGGTREGFSGPKKRRALHLKRNKISSSDRALGCWPNISFGTIPMEESENLYISCMGMVLIVKENLNPPQKKKNNQEIMFVIWYPPFLGTWNSWWWCFFFRRRTHLFQWTLEYHGGQREANLEGLLCNIACQNIACDRGSFVSFRLFLVIYGELQHHD